jgi:hypothetical protein
MPELNRVSEKNFRDLLVIVHNARSRNRALLRDALRAGDTAARDKHIEIERDLIEQHHALIDLQAKYEASITEESLAEKELKSLVANARNRVRKVRNLADALNAVAELANKITRFAAML